MGESMQPPRSLSMLFQEVADLVRESPTDDQAASNDTRLRLYGLYKRVKDGPCLNPSDAPTRLQVVARAKYQSWTACSSLSKEQAMLEYVELVSTLDNDVGREWAKRMDVWKRANDSSSRDDSESVMKDEQKGQKDNPIPCGKASDDKSFLSAVTGFLGIHPMVPRGRLDISYADLWFAARQCLKQNTMVRYCQLEDDISSLWNSRDSSIVVGLSVRSLLDLYLRVMSYPKGSQVIVAPAVNIPGMMDVLRHHEIEIVPVDMVDESIRVDCSAVAKLITDNTVAIMVVHPFGQCSTTPEDMEALRKVSDSRGLQIWDDKAECFAGIQNTMIDSKADLSFVSFGTLKTCTALGGGLAFVNRQETADKMRRLHNSLYFTQPTFSYFLKIAGCVIMKFVTEHPVLYGLIFAFCQEVGLNFDTLVYICVRSFSHRTSLDSSGRKHDNQETRSTQILIKQLRCRPSVSLLSLLKRRLNQNMKECSSVHERIKRCKVMTRLLSGAAPHIVPINANTSSTCWLFPVFVDDPESLCRSLRDKGWDVTRGSSQLQCVADGSSSNSKCPKTHTLMQKIVYLPITSVPMTNAAMQLASDVDAALFSVPSLLCCSRENADRFSRFLLFVLFVSMVLLMGTTSVFKLMDVLIRFVVLLCSAAAAVAIVVRRSVADLYVEGSHCFAKYNKLLDREEMEDNEQKIPSSETSLLGMKVLTLPAADSVHERGDWSHVVVTGATGFIGSMLLRDLLLHRKSLKVEGVILLCRSKRGLSAVDRIAKLLDKTMFNFLTTEQKTSLVHVLDADVTKARAGLNKENYAWICNEKRVSLVIHCAASVKFTQSLREAAISNIASALNMQTLVADLKSSSAQYVHISTAFVHGNSTGTFDNPLSERPYPLRGYDPNEIYSSMLGMQFYASSAMADLGFPNTYAFSKCVCEHLLLQDCSVATVIIRPSIVGPAIQEPYEGWAGDRPSTIVAAASLYLSFQWNVWCFGAYRVPYIPVDVVARFVLAKAFAQKLVAASCCSSPSPSSSDEEFEKISLPREKSFESSNKKHSCQEEDRVKIFNAAWDSASPEASGFSWVDYAVTVTHVGSIMGYFSRFTAYVGLLVAVRLLPYFKLSVDTYAQLHKCFVQLPVEIFGWALTYIGWHPAWMKDVSRLSPFLDLPLLFYPFMNNDFFFHSELVAPEGINGERYLFLCAASAVRLLGGVRSERSGEGQLAKPDHRGSVLPDRRCSVLPIHFDGDGSFSDIWWSITKPKGGIALRLSGCAFRKILRACSVSLTVDVGSFSVLAQESSKKLGGRRIHKVLVPTHRSFFDFILLSYIAFALPEIGLEIPYIAASDEFSRIPFVGWAARMCKAFFIQRGLGRPDPELHAMISALKTNDSGRGACIEVFVEGTRSRDRRFVPAKTGLLR
jgi:perosamine synthetase